MTSKWPLNDLKMIFKLKNNYRFLKHKLSAFHWYISCHDVKKLIFLIFLLPPPTVWLISLQITLLLYIYTWWYFSINWLSCKCVPRWPPPRPLPPPLGYLTNTFVSGYSVTFLFHCLQRTQILVAPSVMLWTCKLLLSAH